MISQFLKLSYFKVQATLPGEGEGAEQTSASPARSQEGQHRQPAPTGPEGREQLSLLLDSFPRLFPADLQSPVVTEPCFVE